MICCCAKVRRVRGSATLPEIVRGTCHQGRRSRGVLVRPTPVPSVALPRLAGQDSGWGAYRVAAEDGRRWRCRSIVGDALIPHEAGKLLTPQGVAGRHGLSATR